VTVKFRRQNRPSRPERSKDDRDNLSQAGGDEALRGVTRDGPGGHRGDRFPNTVLKKGAQDLQTGLKVGESLWHYSLGGGRCGGRHTLSLFRFPGVDRVAAGTELRVRIFKEHRPDSFTVNAHRRVAEDDFPLGEPQGLPRTLKPVVRRGETVAWDARFRVSEPSRDYYLVTEGHWRDREGCGGDQYAFWSFHVKTGR
jgi:hypothetical protein